MYDKNTYLAAAAVWDLTVGKRLAASALTYAKRCIDTTWDLYVRHDEKEPGYGHERIMSVINDNIERQLDGRDLGVDRFRINARNEKLGNYAELSVVTTSVSGKGCLWGVTLMPNKLRVVCLEYGSGVSKMSPLYQLDLESNDRGLTTKFSNQFAELGDPSNAHLVDTLYLVLNALSAYCIHSYQGTILQQQAYLLATLK